MSAVASATAGADQSTREVDRRGIATLSLGHCCVDISQGSVPALLPFLITQRGYGYGAAAALVLAMTAFSSLLQPLFGFLADKRSLSWLLPGGIALAAINISLVGLVDGYAATFALVALAGIGVGAYHPEGARWANYVSGDRRATGMSLYSVGGNIGFALGPIIVTPFVLLFGLGGTVWLAAPLLIAAALLARELPRLRRFHPACRPATGSADARATQARDRWGPFTLVASIAALRSGTWFALQAFVPVWFVTRFDSSVGVGNAALTTMLIAGAVGTLVGGRVADRVGRRRVMIACSAVLTPLLLLVLAVGEIVSFPLLALVGFFTVSTFAITVVLGQESLPNRIGIASGVTVGAAIGIGGVLAWLLGLLADELGLTTTLIVTAALPLAALVLAVRLPDDARSPRRAGG